MYGGYRRGIQFFLKRLIYKYLKIHRKTTSPTLQIR